MAWTRPLLSLFCRPGGASPLVRERNSLWQRAREEEPRWQMVVQEEEEEEEEFLNHCKD